MTVIHGQGSHPKLPAEDEAREEAARAEIERKLGSQVWRLCNLYWVENEEGKRVKFTPRWEQRELHNNLHSLTIAEKCRQPGISTYCHILLLDLVLFSPNKTVGLIDKTLNDAERKMARVKFAYDNLDAEPLRDSKDEDTSKIGALIKRSRVLLTDNKKELTWSNGSKFWAGTSMRGGTLQFLWWSEAGYTSFYFPQAAHEIVKGALNTVHPKEGGRIIIESTHEGGKFGEFYKLLKLAMEAPDPPGIMDWKFVFFAWWRRVTYQLDVDPRYVMPDDLVEYFQLIEKKGIHLTPEQKHWYAKKKATIGDAMLAEYPSTPDEPFESLIKGAIYGKIVSQLRAAKRVVDFEHERNVPLYTFWDIGYSDFTSMWLCQFAGRDILALEYRCNCREGPEYYVGIVREWERKYNRPIDTHFLPHDADAHEKSGKTYRDYLRELGLANTKVVVRVPDLWIGIRRLRSLLPRFYFHKTNCGQEWNNEGTDMPSGITCIESYHTKEDASSGIIRDVPVHDAHSHGASALRTLAEAEMNGLIPGTSNSAGLQPGRTLMAGWDKSNAMLKRPLSRSRML